MSEAYIHIEHLKKYFDVGKNRSIKAVDDVSLDIYPGEILGVVGESGCGKSTMGRCIMRLIDITDGLILMDGKEVHALNPTEMKALRRRNQMVFQNPFSSFNPKHTIGRALYDVAGLFGMNHEEAKKTIYELLELIRLDESILARHPDALSGGQLQRLAIARALIPHPVFILADEPVSALDVSVQAQILNLMLELREKFNQTMLFISHELSVVEHICDRVVVMYLGSVMEMGTTEHVFSSTSHPYSRALLASKPRETPDAPIREIEMNGNIPDAMDMPSGCKFHPRCPLCVAGKCDTEVPPLQEIERGHFCACFYPQKLKEACLGANEY